ncbi:MAG TPA: enoyl-CoA hydratase/isomerase family protein [Thermoanaerobaculia bacterium]|nr:enoyl-CoA hydratase/isomerase family protein [Thermoanaerobaculia bacterium]
MLERDIREGILTLRLAHGKASAMDLELCESLRTEVQSVAGRDDVRAIILTGTGSIFSAGVDLPRLVAAGGDYIPRFLRALDDLIRALFGVPKPLIAAVNGHAIAGGAIMAFAADYRLMSSGRIGVPELLVGVPFPPLPLALVRFAVPPQHVQSMVYLGKTIEAPVAREMGIIDEAVEPDQLMPRANAIATQLGAIPREAFAMVKRQIREPFLHPTEVDVIPFWSQPETHQRIRQYLERTIGKR